MKRRDFALGLGAMAAAVGLVRPARAQEYADGIEVGGAYPVELYHGGDAIRVNRVIAFDGARAVAIAWTGGAALFPENRVDLSNVAGLSAILRTPFRRRWWDAARLGDVFVTDQPHTLLARVPDADALAGKGATLGAGDYSWDLPGVFAPVDAASAVAAVAGRQIGAARREVDGRMLIKVSAYTAQF